MTREAKAQEYARNCAEYNNLPVEVEHLLHTAFIAGYNEREDEEKKTCHQVSEELPKVDKFRKYITVLARKGDNVFIAFYSVLTGFNLSSSFYSEWAISGITHWMPIPEIKED